MVATFKTLKTKRKQHQVRSARFIRSSVNSAALCEKFVTQKFFSHIPILGSKPNRDFAICCARGRSNRFSQRNYLCSTPEIFFAPSTLRGETLLPTGTQPISNYLYQGMTLDAITGLYYARNRNYSPTLGVWISQDPLQYVNGANTYQMEGSAPVGSVDPSGGQVNFGPLPPPGWPPRQEPTDVTLLEIQAADWYRQGDYYASMMMHAFVTQQFQAGESGMAFNGISAEIIMNSKYRQAMRAHFRKLAEQYGRPGKYKLPPITPPTKGDVEVDFKPAGYSLVYAANLLIGYPHVSDLGIALGVGHFGYLNAVMQITGCPGHLKWTVTAYLVERNLYHFHPSPWNQLDPVYNAGVQLQHGYGFKPFYQQSVWPDGFSGSLGTGAGD